MIARDTQGIADKMAAALDWWRDAGVDCDFHDDPADWLAKPAEPEPVAEGPRPSPQLQRTAMAEAATTAAAPKAAQIGGNGAPLPATLDAFARWWMEEPSLDGGRVAQRVPPRGHAHAAVMVLVAEPEAGDNDTLLSGREGQLLTAMLAAMGFAPDQAYVASCLPRHTPLADWQMLAAQGLGRIVRHHVGLAVPERLFILGGNILPLLGNDLPNSAQNSPRFNHEGLSVPLLAGPDLATMLARPGAKARIWRDWLALSRP